MTEAGLLERIEALEAQVATLMTERALARGCQSREFWFEPRAYQPALPFPSDLPERVRFVDMADAEALAAFGPLAIEHYRPVFARVSG